MRKTTTMRGTVSHGTMRPEDLIPCFVSVADSIKDEIGAPGSTTEPGSETMERSRMVGRIDDLLGEIERRMESDDYFDTEDAGRDLEALFDLLSDLAPEGYYFGANEGDGSDYGFWRIESDDTNAD